MIALYSNPRNCCIMCSCYYTRLQHLTSSNTMEIGCLERGLYKQINKRGWGLKITLLVMPTHSVYLGKHSLDDYAQAFPLHSAYS